MGAYGTLYLFVNAIVTAVRSGVIKMNVDTATHILRHAKNGESVVLRLCPQHSPYAATIQSHSAAGAIALERIRRAS